MRPGSTPDENRVAGSRTEKMDAVSAVSSDSSGGFPEESDGDDVVPGDGTV